ncbi:aminotransferase class IV [Ancylobacter sp. VNQ12]|uniref:aminotransferase class IV n=1 Tax=Ancylobacter sp. VNQ12 TaxID=3400920 RepID=UPI003C09D6B6
MSPVVSAADRGFTLGDGVFDTALALNGKVFARERHIVRLIDAARTIGIEVDRRRIEDAIDAALTAAPAIIRTTLTRGTAARGLWPASAGAPTVLVTTSPWSPALLGQTARLVTASGRRNEFSPTANLKTLGYLDHILAAREAALAGADDALILNTQGRVACSAIANIFALVEGTLVTPPLSEGCLPGIMRALVIEMAPALGFAVAERPLLPETLAGAEAVFLTNSVRVIRAVTALDGREFAEHRAIARLAEALKARLTAECGDLPAPA